MAATSHRARDPGLRLGQYGSVTWVHCPECDGAARSDSHGVSCLRCGYVTIQKLDQASVRWVRVRGDDPLCSHCRRPLPTEPVPTGFEKGGKLFARISCPHCGETVDYRALPAHPPAGASQEEPRRLRLYLTARVSGHLLWVDNLAHLEALEQYLGASLRERGPVAGLTMMARLPRWMKAATARPKVLRALARLRQKARRAGIDR